MGALPGFRMQERVVLGVASSFMVPLDLAPMPGTVSWEPVLLHAGRLVSALHWSPDAHQESVVGSRREMPFAKQDPQKPHTGAHG